MHNVKVMIALFHLQHYSVGFDNILYRLLYIIKMTLKLHTQNYSVS